MKTITAKELRDNLNKVVDQVRAGERIRVTYRSKPAFTITPESPSSKRIEPGSNQALKNFLKRVNARKQTHKKHVFNPEKSVKELYHEMLDNDPKYKPPYYR